VKVAAVSRKLSRARRDIPMAGWDRRSWIARLWRRAVRIGSSIRRAVVPLVRKLSAGIDAHDGADHTAAEPSSDGRRPPSLACARGQDAVHDHHEYDSDRDTERGAEGDSPP
jgi:hypothetical protein